MMLGMSELQLSLIVIGSLSVGGVWIYNRWQEYRQRKQTQAAFQEPLEDALMQPSAEQDSQGETAERYRVKKPANITSHELPQAAAPSMSMERIEPSCSTWSELDEAVAPNVPTVPNGPNASGTADESVQDEPPGRFEPEEMTGDFSAEDEALPTNSCVAPKNANDQLSEAVLETDLPPVPETFAAISTTGEIPLLDTVAESRPPLELADEEIECVVHLQANELIAAPLFWDAQRKLLTRLAKRIRWSGLDENAGRWQLVQANDANSYRQLVAALQIVDRQGPLAADDLALYCDGLRQLISHYQARAIVPVVADVVARARALDEFCASVDWQLSLNLLHPDGQALSIASLRQIAEVVGLHPQARDHLADGRLYALDSHGMTAYSLSLLGGPSFSSDETATTALGLMLRLDVPRVEDGIAAFDRMLQLAQVINTRIGAVIVDEQRAPLKPEMLSMIRSKIVEFQQKMIARQIPPGSRRALRLYA